MHRRLFPTFTAVAAAVVVILGIGAVNPAPSSAAPRPLTVHAGPTGVHSLDNICGQMADLINAEIAAGVNDELNGNQGEANAWYSQAQDHIDRARAMGCNLAMRHISPGGRLALALEPVHRGVSSATSTPPSRRLTHVSITKVGDLGIGRSNGHLTSARKRIYGTYLGHGVSNMSQSSCDTMANYVNTALDNSEREAQAGHLDAAAGWRQAANDMLAAGREAGCSWYAV
jgi:hypothetical protein